MTLARALAPYARPRRSTHDSCELCAAPLGGAHRHVVDLERRALCCACRPCASLFTDSASGNGTFRTVPERVLVDPSRPLTEELWSDLEVPVRLAFLYFNSRLARWVAFYPSPAGPTESELSSKGLLALQEKSALAAAIEPDVEALLVHGSRGQNALESFLVPIDLCYELTGLIREHWKGFDGGDARTLVEAFFARVRARSRPLRPVGGAS